MDNYIFITKEGDPLPIADRLQDDGKNVIVGLVKDEGADENPGKEEMRKSLYDGILEKMDADTLIKYMEGFSDKHDWFVMFDYGDLWAWSERVLKMGFTKGVFPTEEGYSLEEDRKAGKEFAKQHYPDLKVADAPEFKSADDGIAFLEENPEKIYVLKSEGSEAETVVPETSDPELARFQLIGALSSERADYEKGGFTLEEKIKNPIEISPVMVFYDGEPLFSLVELENKGFGSGNIGRLTGGSQNLTIQTELGCKLNQIAFPDIIYKMASKQPGISVYDAGLINDGEDFYFTEFCGQRWGWDGIFSEISMCDTPSRHFDLICEGKNPLVHSYGAAVRMFQTLPHCDCPEVYQDGYTVDWLEDASDYLYFYCIQKKEIDGKQKFVSVGYRKDFGVACAGSKFMEGAVMLAYAAARSVAMTGMYYRPQFDFLSENYRSSIKNRYRWLIKSELI